MLFSMRKIINAFPHEKNNNNAFSPMLKIVLFSHIIMLENNAFSAYKKASFLLEIFFLFFSTYNNASFP